MRGWRRRRESGGLQELKGRGLRDYEEFWARARSPQARAVGEPDIWGHYLVKMKDGREQHLPCITQHYELDDHKWSMSLGPTVGPMNSGTMLQFTYDGGRPNVMIPLSQIDYYLHKNEPPPAPVSTS